MPSSSSCGAASTDIPDPLSLFLPIINRLRPVFGVTSYQDFVNEFMIIKIFDINSLENVIYLLKIEGFSLVTEIHIPVAKICDRLLSLMKVLQSAG